MLDLGHIDTVIHDFDGVHYPYRTSAEGLDFFQICDETLADVALKLFPTISRESLLDLAKAGYFEHGDCYTAFTLAARGWTGFEGIPPEEIRDALFSPYHNALFARTERDLPQVFDYAARAKPWFEALNGHVRHAILSHGCRETFINPFLAQANITSHFHTVFGMAEIEFHNKGRSPRPLEIVLETLDANPARTAFLEDSLQNLRIAKEHYPALTTVHIHHGTPPDSKPEWVDLEERDVSHLLKRIAAFHQDTPPIFNIR